MIIRDKNDLEIAMIVSGCAIPVWNYVLLRSVTPVRPIGQIGLIVDSFINNPGHMGWETFVPKR